MWLPNTDPSGNGLIVSARFRGQEGAAENAPMHRNLGVLGVTGFLMRDVTANPLDYVEGGPLNHFWARCAARRWIRLPVSLCCPDRSRARWKKLQRRWRRQRDSGQRIPSAYDRLGLIVDWVDNGKAPGKSVTVTAGERSLPMCSYPEYPKYSNGPAWSASSYTCAAK